MSSRDRVFYNKDLFTNIVSYLDDKNLKSIVPDLRKMVHHDYIAPHSDVLLYGQVQSGKTKKIMEYVRNFKPHTVKIVIIQNNVKMLEQYSNVFTTQNISFREINRDTYETPYKKEQVIITIFNKFRMHMLIDFIRINRIVPREYCLVLDESDMYLHRYRMNLCLNVPNTCYTLQLRPLGISPILSWTKSSKLRLP